MRFLFLGFIVAGPILACGNRGSAESHLDFSRREDAAHRSLLAELNVATRFDAGVPNPFEGRGGAGGGSSAEAAAPSLPSDRGEQRAAIMGAVAGDNLAFVRQYGLVVGLYLRTRFSRGGHTLLHLARTAEMVRLLIDQGADPHARNDERLTPLRLAIVTYLGNGHRLKSLRNNDGRHMPLEDDDGFVVDDSFGAVLDRTPVSDEERQRQLDLIEALAMADLAAHIVIEGADSAWQWHKQFLSITMHSDVREVLLRVYVND